MSHVDKCQWWFDKNDDTKTYLKKISFILFHVHLEPWEIPLHLCVSSSESQVSWKMFIAFRLFFLSKSHHSCQTFISVFYSDCSKKGKHLEVSYFHLKWSHLNGYNSSRVTCKRDSYASMSFLSGHNYWAMLLSTEQILVSLNVSLSSSRWIHL